MPDRSAQSGQYVKRVVTGTAKLLAASVIRSLQPRYIRETTTSPLRGGPGAITPPASRLGASIRPATIGLIITCLGLAG
jgi:hypothetical protein